ncbi:MAG: protein-L-isoaspartate(D-aspartate) O-methyltransferase [Crenarchaeota archaeon]|nr:protein-L-isoaspartate(D-aspartate) O-methyltransferase [Thermoproteota archaeon]
MEERRKELAEKLVREGYIRRPEVARAMLKVPRELFVPEGLREYAYEDRPLPIGMGQTISAPHMVAYMVEAAEIGRGDRVLEVGTGSGYHAAIMAELVGPEGHVYTIERIPELAEQARERLRALGYDNVTVIVSDGSKGYPPAAPYDKIIVTAAARRIPPKLLEQLKVGGVMVIPVEEEPGYQVLYKIVKKPEGLEVRRLLPVAFVPLIEEE